MSDSLQNFTVEKSTDNQQSWGPIAENAFGLGPGVYPPSARQANDSTDPSTLPSKTVYYRLRQTTAHQVTVPYDVVSLGSQAAGSTAWADMLEGTSSYAQSVVVDRDTVTNSGDIVLVGYFTGTTDFDSGSGSAPLTSVGAYDMFLSKYLPGGAYKAGSAKRYGNSGSEVPLCCGLDHDGNIFIGGYFTGVGDVGAGPMTSAGAEDIFIGKYTTAGTNLWAKQYSGAGVEGGGIAQDNIVYIAVDGNGDVFITGYYRATSGSNQHPYVAKLSGVDGHKLWWREFSTVGDAFIKGLAVDSSNDLILCGQLTSGTMNFGSGVITTVDGYGSPAILTKLSGVDGHELWPATKVFMGQYYAADGLAIALDSQDNIFFGGRFASPTLDFGCGSLATSNGGGNPVLFLVKLSGLNGGCLDSPVFATQSIDAVSQVNAVTVDDDNNVVITGFFQRNVTLGPSSFSAVIPGGSTVQDAYVAKYRGSNFGPSAIQWAVQFAGTTTASAVAPLSITTDAARNVITSGGLYGSARFNGVFRSSGATGYNGYLVKLAP